MGVPPFAKDWVCIFVVKPPTHFLLSYTTDSYATSFQKNDAEKLDCRAQTTNNARVVGWQFA